MEIREVLTEEEKIEIAIKTLELSGIMQERLRKMRKANLIRVVVGLVLVAEGFLLRSQGRTGEFGDFSVIFGSVYGVLSLLALIYAKQIDVQRIRKSLKNNRKVLEKNGMLSALNEECVTVIENDYAEITERGTSTKYLKKDYVRNFEDEKFCILEFTNGRFIFFKKDTFSGKDEFSDVIREIAGEQAVEK